MEKLSPHVERIEHRYEALYQWIEKYKPLIISSDKVKITLNISGNSIKGSVENFPE
jgi:hypothetical protein